MTGFRRLWSALLAAGMVLFATLSSAQEDKATEARRLYTEARKAMSDKKYKEAALGFEQASELSPHAVALYTAAQAWELAGEPGRAADAYSLALATPKLSDAQAERSRERLAELEKRVGTVVIVGSESIRVRLDDHLEMNAPARLHGTAGEHQLQITRSDGTVDTQKVTLAVGEAVEIDVDVKAEEPTSDEPPKPKPVPLAEPAKQPVRVEEKGPSALTTIGFITAGAGVATLAGAAVLGLSAKDAEETYKNSPTQDTLDHAKGLETKTNIMFVVGGVLTAAGVGLVVWQSMGSEEQPSSAFKVRAGPGSLFAEGSF